jgi:Tol biopolymer transport system component
LNDARPGPATLIADHPQESVLLPFWSPDGHFLAYSTMHDGRGSVYVIDMTSRKPKQPVRISGDADAGFLPAWQPLP